MKHPIISFFNMKQIKILLQITWPRKHLQNEKQMCFA